MVNLIKKIVTDEGTLDAAIVSIKRVPEEPVEDRNRVTIIQLQSKEVRNQILTNAKKLKNTEEYQQVYIDRDMTKKERHEQYLLRRELKQRRDRGERVAIRKGKVVAETRKAESEDEEEDEEDESTEDEVEDEDQESTSRASISQPTHVRLPKQGKAQKKSVTKK